VLLKLGGFFFLVTLIFWLWAVFDCITSDNERIRNLPKIVWVIIVIAFLEFGALAWVLLGRPQGTRPWAGPSGRARPTGLGPVGPDDDPDFLRKI
jgi:hypothetical protein